jgi:hypothetical protein
MFDQEKDEKACDNCRRHRYMRRNKVEDDTMTGDKDHRYRERQPQSAGTLHGVQHGAFANA